MSKNQMTYANAVFVGRTDDVTLIQSLNILLFESPTRIVFARWSGTLPEGRRYTQIKHLHTVASQDDPQYRPVSFQEVARAFNVPHQERVAQTISDEELDELYPPKK